MIESFFDPAWIVNGKPYNSFMYEQILKEQLIIAYLSKGAITLTETNDMPINDRRILLATLQQAEEDKKKRLEELKQQRQIRKATGK